jgi:hypothetical protein
MMGTTSGLNCVLTINIQQQVLLQHFFPFVHVLYDRLWIVCESGQFLYILVVFHLRSFFFSFEDGTRISMGGTYCKLMIVIFCVVILYVFLIFLFVCHQALLVKVAAC